MNSLIAIVALGFAMAACADTTTTTRAPVPPSAPPIVAPPPAFPPVTAPQVPAPAQRGDNCGLDPADMDRQTKIQCGLPGGSEPPEESGSPDGLPTDGLESSCSNAAWREQMGDAGDARCGAGSEGGSGESNTETPQDETYLRYQEEAGYPFSEEQYDELPGYLQCGTACGEEPTSGEVQRQHLCERGQEESC